METVLLLRFGDGQPLFFSQNAALKLFTNAKTSDVCEKRFGLPGVLGSQGPRGQHSPQLARSTEPCREKRVKNWCPVLAPMSSEGLGAILKIHSAPKGMEED